jgi:hypothetical protein
MTIVETAVEDLDAPRALVSSFDDGGLYKLADRKEGTHFDFAREKPISAGPYHPRRARFVLAWRRWKRMAHLAGVADLEEKDLV